MIWDGNTVYALWGYRPDTRPAIEWLQVADGNWKAVDRGASEDVFEAVINFRGPESELSDLESTLGSIGGANEANRESFSITCGEGEEIFGADIDYSGSLTVAVVGYGKIRRVSYPAYTMPLRLRLLSPSTTGSASISDLRIDNFSYEAGSEWDLNKQFTYDGSANYLDGATDPGIFKAVFRQKPAEMKAIRRYLLTTARTAVVGFPSFGVDKPFGQRMGTGPFNVKIINWRDLGRDNFSDWRIEITFARVFS